MKGSTKAYILGLFGSAAAILPLAAHAEQTVTNSTQAAVTSSSPTPAIAEVIVTAQRRSQSLQKTALTIEVLQGKALETAGITSPLQLTTVIPSFQIGNSGPASSVYVRGVGGYSSTAQSNPAIPFYIDGVYVARSQSVSSEFYDIDRVEALVGPQGTLYGRNASGGAINVITRQPVLGRYSVSGEFEGGNYSDKTGEIAVNLPIGSTAALRISADDTDKGGYTSEGFGDDVHQSARAKLLWKPDSNLSLLLNASGGYIGGRGPAYVLLNKNVPGWYPWLDGTSPQAQALIIATGPPGLTSPTTPQESHQNLDFVNVSAQLDWNLGFATLMVVPAYRYARMSYNNLITFDYEDGNGFGVYPNRPETSDESSIETRLSGNTNRLKWVAGLYYYHESQFDEYGTNAGIIEHTGYVDDLDTKSYAAFGQATYSVTPHIRLIGGLRYTADNRGISNGASYDVNPTLLGSNGVPCIVSAPAAPACLSDTFQGDKTFYNLSWKGGFEADVLQDSLLYATVSRGFKAGGFNTQSGSTPGQAQEYAPELLTSYEMGLKNRFFGNRLQVNLDGYYWDYDNHQEQQIGVTANGAIDQIFVNAGNARIYGGDVSIVARLWRGGTFNSSAEYAHSKYDNFSYSQPLAFTGVACPTTPTGAVNPLYGPVVTVNCAGKQVARTPEWSGSVGFTQDIQLGASKFTGNINTTFATARWLAVEFTPVERAGAYALVNASLTYQLAGAPWAVTGFVRNLNNGRDYTFAIASAVSSAVVADIGPPRTYGAQFSFSF